jgi:hypothetical protein
MSDPIRQLKKTSKNSNVLSNEIKISKNTRAGNETGNLVKKYIQKGN